MAHSETLRHSPHRGFATCRIAKMRDSVSGSILAVVLASVAI
jgi:hypothetical protein